MLTTVLPCATDMHIGPQTDEKGAHVLRRHLPREPMLTLLTAVLHSPVSPGSNYLNWLAVLNKMDYTNLHGDHFQMDKPNVRTLAVSI